MESARIQSFSGPYFPAFGVNTDHKKLRIRTLFTQYMGIGTFVCKSLQEDQIFWKFTNTGILKTFCWDVVIAVKLESMMIRFYEIVKNTFPHQSSDRYLFTFIGIYPWVTLRKKCPHSELFWSSFFRIQSEYGQFSRSVNFCSSIFYWKKLNYIIFCEN